MKARLAAFALTCILPVVTVARVVADVTAALPEWASVHHSTTGCEASTLRVSVPIRNVSDAAMHEDVINSAIIVIRAGEVLAQRWDKLALQTSQDEIVLQVNVSLEAQRTHAHVYVLNLNAGSATLFGIVPLPACLEPARDVRVHPRPAGALPHVGLLYEGWHSYAYNASATVVSMGGTPLSVDDVIRSDGNLTLADIWDVHGVQNLTQGRSTPRSESCIAWHSAIRAHHRNNLTAGFYYQAMPSAGPYCTYRRRNGEAGVLPDCPGISATIARHASLLTAAGIDFVTADGTNLCTPSPFADAIQTRPFEVLLEEFTALRARGLSTPAVAAWQRSVTGCTLHTSILGIYNNATLSELIYRDPVTGKMVFFVPDSPDASIIAEIESNGGRNNVIVQEMWALFGNATYASGRWAFESPCTDGGRFTTSVAGRGRGATACGQFTTFGSRLGSALAVGPSFQMSYGSVPFSAAGTYGGLTLKRQFATAIDAASRGATHDNLYVSSWNEAIAQPQPNPFGAPDYAFSMGLPWDTAGRGSLWVDSYGGLSRDLEPSAAAGSLLYDIMASCLRVVHLMGTISAREPTYALRLRDSAALAAAACAVAGEVCCLFNETTDGYASVQALSNTAGKDALVTTDPAEAARLTCPGCGWTEICNPFDGPTDFCISREVLAGPRAMQGPFVLHSGGCAVRAGDPVVQGRTPLVRCLEAPVAGGRHYVSPDATACGGGGATLEVALGCMSTSRSSETPRALRACTANGGRRYHSLDASCEAGDTDDYGRVLGFVH